MQNTSVLIYSQILASYMSSGEMQLKIKNTLDAYTHVECLGDNRITRDISDPAPLLNFSASVGGSNAATYLGKAEYETLVTKVRKQLPSDIFFVDLPDRSSGIVWAWSLSSAQIALVPCTFELGWFLSQLQWFRSNVSSSQRPTQLNSSNVRRARADQEWLSFVNPYIEEKNMTVFGSIVNSVIGFPGAGDKAYFLPLAQRIVTMLLSAALSNTPPQLFNYGFTTNPTVSESFPLAYPLEYSISGYGYGPNVLAVQVSLVILSLYCMVTIAHILYSVWTGNSSSAWDSISELVALAINSRPAQELQDTCAGIYSAKIFGQRVRIAPTGGALPMASIAHETEDTTVMPAATAKSYIRRTQTPRESTRSVLLNVSTSSISVPDFKPTPTVEGQEPSTCVSPTFMHSQPAATAGHLELVFASSGILGTAKLETNCAYGALSADKDVTAGIKLKVE